MSVSILKQGMIQASGEQINVPPELAETTGETLLQGFVETATTPPTKIYENYVGTTEFIEW